MNFFASLLAFLGSLLLLLVLGTIIRVITRGRGGFITALLPFLILLLIIAGVSFYLDNNGDIVPGTVEAKNEQIVTYDTGIYMRFLDLDVNFKPRDGGPGNTIRMPVDGPLFDSVHQGDTVQVRYINPAQLFIFSQLKQQTTFSLIPWSGVWFGFLIVWFVALVLLGTRKSRPDPNAVVEPGSGPVPPNYPYRGLSYLLLIPWVAALLFTLFQPVLMPLSADSTWQSTTAQIKSVRRYTEVTQNTRSSKNIPLIQPFDMVQFTFVPQGHTDPVIGVDVVDTTSPTVPDQGTSVEIKYSPADPRQVLIKDANRTHYWKNPLGGLAISLATLSLLWLFYFTLRLGWKVLTGGLSGALARR